MKLWFQSAPVNLLNNRPLQILKILKSIEAFTGFNLTVDDARMKNDESLNQRNFMTF